MKCYIHILSYFSQWLKMRVKNVAQLIHQLENKLTPRTTVSQDVRMIFCAVGLR